MSLASPHSTGAPANDELAVATEVVRATVHRNGALVVRAAELPAAPSAPCALVLPGLPLGLASDSVRVRLCTPGGAPYLDLELGAVQEDPELGHAVERSGELDARLATLRLEREDVRARLNAWRVIARTHEGLKLPAKPDLNPEDGVVVPDIAAWLGLAELAGAGRERSAEAVEAFEEALVQLEGRIADVQRRLASEVDEDDGEVAVYTRTLRVPVRRRSGASSTAGPVVVEVEYFVSGARWAPLYALHIDAEGGQARFEMAAWVAQATGEDWRAASLAVSSADLRRETRLPELGAWRIGRRRSPETRGWRPLPEGIDALFTDADAASPPPGHEDRTLGRATAAEAAAAAAAARSAADAASATGAGLLASTIFDESEEVDDLDGMLGAHEAPSPPPQLMRAAAPPPPPAPMPMAEMAPRADRPKRRASTRGRASVPEPRPAGGAARAKKRRGEREVQPPPPPGPGELLDYAWLRLPRWTEPGRGRLSRVDALTDLRALVEARGGDPTRYRQLERAQREARAAVRRLHKQPLPPGCVAISGVSFHHRYDASAAVDVPADGRFHRVPLAGNQVALRELVRVVPRQDTRVRRVAVMENPLQAPLPSGPMRVYEGGGFRVTAAHKGCGPTGKLEVGLGIDEGVRVARNTNYSESERGVISSTAVAEHTVTTTLRNTLSRAVEVEVFERLPQADDLEDVEVSLGEAAPAPVRDVGPDGLPADGALRWSLRIAPGASAEIRYHYTVSLPAKQEIVGGNRREP